MRILTWNVNGLRAADRKGISAAIESTGADVLLFQEVRATVDQLPKEWVERAGWHAHWNPAEKLGYAGTAIISRQPIKIESIGLGGAGKNPDPEGRLVFARIGPVRIACVYLPSGSSGEHRQVEKEKWMKRFRPWADAIVSSRVPTVMGGDFNIARTPLDIFHAKSNEKNSGFLPHERAWMDDLVASGWADWTRESAGDAPGPYSWWSQRGNARALDRGWRIDYLLGNKAASKKISGISTARDLSLTISDHAPVVADLDV